MRGQDHIITAMALTADVGLTLFWFQKGETPDILQKFSGMATEFLTEPVGDMSMWLFGLISVTLFLIGTILPDIDHPESIIGRWAYLPVKHRTWTHAIYGSIIFWVIGLFYRPVFYLGWGTFCHSFFDDFSATGTPWLYPLKRKHHLTLYHTGEMSECVVTVLFVLFSLFYGLFVLQQVYHLVEVRWTA